MLAVCMVSEMVFAGARVGTVCHRADEFGLFVLASVLASDMALELSLGTETACMRTVGRFAFVRSVVSIHVDPMRFAGYSRFPSSLHRMSFRDT
jgi:hypothetical protein